MKQSFNKIIKGHDLEFNRLLYPVRYSIMVKDIDSTGLSITAEKNNEGKWSVDKTDKVPRWIAELSADIHETICENEHLIAQAV